MTKQYMAGISRGSHSGHPGCPCVWTARPIGHFGTVGDHSSFPSTFGNGTRGVRRLRQAPSPVRSSTREASGVSTAKPRSQRRSALPAKQLSRQPERCTEVEPRERRKHKLHECLHQAAFWCLSSDASTVGSAPLKGPKRNQVRQCCNPCSTVRQGRANKLLFRSFRNSKETSQFHMHCTG